VLWDASLHCTFNVYTRPVPVPDLSALSFAVRFPVICQSGVVWPLPGANAGSLLLIPVILQTGLRSQVSFAVTEIVTEANL
jgi:hypothetical protein